MKVLPGSKTPGEGLGYSLQYSWASLVAQMVKNPPAIQETWVQFLGWEDPLEEGMATPLQYSCLENPQGQRILAGYNLWGHKELDTTEQLNTAHEICALHYWLLNTYEIMEGSCGECIQLFTLMS